MANLEEVDAVLVQAGGFVAGLIRGNDPEGVPFGWIGGSGCEDGLRELGFATGILGSDAFTFEKRLGLLGSDTVCSTVSTACSAGVTESRARESRSPS